ncbi:MAG: MCE family protein [Lentisphaeria bacterium]|nr:MCE family protein [Lentisphaeria bacterium]
MQEANKFKLGLFVITGIIILIAAVFSMGLFDSLRPKVHMVTYVEESVQGLSRGSAVKYKGVPIGQVSDIFIMIDNNEIRIDIEIDLTKIQRRTQNTLSGPLLPDQFYEYLRKETGEGLACRLEPDGITGSKYIEINFFTDEKAPKNREVAELRDGVIYMPSTPSMMANLRTNIFEILTSVASIDFKKISDQTNELLKRANQTLDQARLARLADNANSAIENLNRAISNVNTALSEKQLRKSVKSMEETLASVRKLSDEVASAVREANLSDTASDLRGLSKSLQDSSDSLRISLQKANDTMDTVTDLVRYINDNPASLIHGRGTDDTQSK